MTKQEFLNLPNKQKFIYKGREFYLNVMEGGFCFVSECDSILFGRTMNFDKVTDKYINLFTYDMMGQCSKYKMSLSEITLSK
jgi:hypothetical protein